MPIRYLDEEEEPKPEIRYLEGEAKNPSKIRYLDEPSTPPPLPSVPGLPGLLGTAAKTVVDQVKPSPPQFSPIGEDILDRVAPSLNPILQPLTKTKSGRRIMGNLSRGISGTVGSTAGALPAIEGLFDIQTPVGQFGEKSARVLREAATKLEPENKTFFDDVVAGAGSMATFMVPSAGAASLVGSIPRFAAMGVKLATLTGVATSTVFESMTEAGGVFMDQIDKGVSREQASKDAFENFSGNAALIAATNLFNVKGSVARKLIEGATKEGIQEGGQEILSSLAKDEKINWKSVFYSMGIGSILGGPTAIAISPSMAEQKIPHAEKQVFAAEYDSLFTPNPKLTPEKKVIEKRTVNYAKEHGNEIISQYRDKNRNYVSTDRLRPFFADVADPNVETNAMHEGISPLKKIIQEQVVREGLQKGKKEAIITGGGPATGKTEWVNSLNESTREDQAIILDSTLENFESNANMLQKLIDKGLRPDLVYIYRDPAQAYAGAKRRPRGVDDVPWMDMTMAAYENFFKLKQRFGDKIKTTVFDNIGVGEPEFSKMPVEELENRRYNKSDLEEVIRNYDREHLSRPYQGPSPDRGGVEPILGSEIREKEGIREREIARAEEREVPAPPPVKPPVRPPVGIEGVPQGQPLPQPVKRTEPTITERFALKRSLQRQAYAAAQAARATTQELTGIKREVVQQLKALPVSERGRFNTIIQNAKTSRDVAKATTRIQNRLDEVIKKELTRELQKTANRAIESPNVDVEYKRRIRSIVDGIQFKERRPDTIQKLTELSNHIQRQMAQGKDVALPKSLLDELKVFHRKSIQEMPVNEVVNLIDKIGLLEHLGRERVVNSQILYQRTKAMKMQDLLIGTQGISKKELIQRPLGEKLTLTQSFANLIRRAQNALIHADIVLSPIDVVMDVLDGSEGYTGANSRMKQDLDTSFGNFMNRSAAAKIRLQLFADQKKLTDQNFERIAVHAYNVQPGGRDYLENVGHTDKEIDAIKLTPDEMGAYQIMREVLEAFYPEVSHIMRTLYNKDIGKLVNYFPVQIDHEAVSDIELFQKMGDMLDAGALGRRTKSVSKGFTELRKGTKKKIKLNAREVFERHVDDAAYLVNMQEKIKMYSEIVNSPRYQAVAGDFGGLVMSQWFDTMARKGGGEGIKRIRILDELRKNFGAARLGLKISSIAIQPTALMDGASLVGPQVFNGLEKVVTSSEWRQFLRDNFPELRNRGADDPAYMDLASNKMMAGIQDFGYSFLKKADVITASAVTAGAYIKAVKAQGLTVDLTKPNPKAIEEATRMLRRTQASAYFKDSPLALTRGALTGNKSFDRALLQFKSFILNRWSLIRHDMWRLGFRGGNPQQGAEIAFWLMNATIVEAGIRASTRVFIALLVGGGIKAAMDELDKEMEGIDKRILMETFGNIPIMGDLVSMGVYEGSPIPALGALTETFSGLHKALKYKKPKSKLRALATAAGGAGSVFGVPGTAQATQLIRRALKEKKKPKIF